MLSAYALSYSILPQTLGGIFVLPFYRWDTWGWASLNSVPKLHRWWQRQVLNSVSLVPESLLLRASLHSQPQPFLGTIKTRGFRAELWLAGATWANGAELGLTSGSGINFTPHHAGSPVARGTYGCEKAYKWVWRCFKFISPVAGGTCDNQVPTGPWHWLSSGGRLPGEAAHSEAVCTMSQSHPPLSRPCFQPEILTLDAKREKQQIWIQFS